MVISGAMSGEVADQIERGNSHKTLISKILPVTFPWLLKILAKF